MRSFYAVCRTVARCAAATSSSKTCIFSGTEVVGFACAVCSRCSSTPLFALSFASLFAPLFAPLFELSALIMAHGPPMAMREIGDNASFGAVRALSRRHGPAGAQGADPGLARPAPMLPP
jgi:hypothetical protein